MLISFSIPAMLPMVCNGLRERGALEDGVDDWLHETPDFAAALGNAGERAKVQTIRENLSALSPWRRCGRGTMLQLWWRSRTPARRLLGTAPCRAVTRIRIGDIHGQHGYNSNGPKVCAIQLRRIAPQSRDSYYSELECGHPNVELSQFTWEHFARRDGFPDAEGFYDYFLARRRLFDGFLIEW